MTTSDETTLAELGGRARSAGIGHRAVTPLVLVVSVLLGVVAGWAAFRFSGSVHLRLSPIHGIALLGAFLAAVAVVRRPVLGLVALVILVYLHLSDVLIRFHDLPSVLQLLALPLLLAVVVEWRGDVLDGLSPWTITAALVAYVLAFALSSVVAEEPALSDGRTVAAAKGFVIYLLVLLLASKPERVRAGAWALVAGGVTLGAVSLFQVATGDFESNFGGLAQIEYAQVYGDALEPRIAGPVGDPNFFAQILLIVVPVALLLAWKERTRWLRLLALGAAIVPAATVLFTYSRGGTLALGLVVTCAIFAARPSRLRAMTGALLLLLGIGLVPLSGDVARRLATLQQLLPDQQRIHEVDTSFQNRILQARVAWRIFVDYPVLGAGAGNYTVHYYDYADRVGSAAPEYARAGGDHYPHNLYLELASEMGVVGLIIFGGALLLVFGHLRRARAAYFAADEELHAGLASALQIALVGYLASSLFLHGHYQRYLWILLGLSAALVRAAPPMEETPGSTGFTARSGSLGRAEP